MRPLIGMTGRSVEQDRAQVEQPDLVVPVGRDDALWAGCPDAAPPDDVLDEVETGIDGDPLRRQHGDGHGLKEGIDDSLSSEL